MKSFRKGSNFEARVKNIIQKNYGQKNAAVFKNMPRFFRN